MSATDVVCSMLTALFAAAALWFPLSALSRRRGERLPAVARSLPSAAGMAAMAWMARPMAGSGHEVLAVHAGHSMGAQEPTTQARGYWCCTCLSAPSGRSRATCRGCDGTRATRIPQCTLERS
ncbi:DUF5134 domain-containing protein [Streptomyces sp. NPDC048275]|uniref:DUF5134 domain-containing protein n=1 Tax=Streptomyces sp. NPDC048275 TaxID=3155629 RepID=UPI0033D3DA9C